LTRWSGENRACGHQLPPGGINHKIQAFQSPSAEQQQIPFLRKRDFVNRHMLVRVNDSESAQVHRIVTDEPPSAQWLEFLSSRNIDILHPDSDKAPEKDPLSAVKANS